VVNNITISTNDPVGSVDIGALVLSLLKNDIWLERYPITVDVIGRTVVLEGTVPSSQLKSRAAELAAVRGVVEVDKAGIGVDPIAAAPKLKVARTTPGDDELKTVLYENYFQNPLVSSSAIQIQVNNGTVTLEGSVATSSAKRAATDSAMATVGVSKVRNNLQIDPPVVVSDSRIGNDAGQALTSGVITNTGSYEISVARGIVTLNGSVPTAYIRSAAEDLVHHLPGVRDVENYLTIEPGVYGSGPTGHIGSDIDPETGENEILSSVRRQLYWSPFVDSESVRVSVVEGVVTLSGTVSSAAEKRSAEMNTIEGGAVAVINNLEVE
jgi:osmotically-inducible protein OsmY